MLLKNYWGSFGCWWTWAYLSLIFIKVQELQIVLRATQTLDVLIFFKKKFCLMSSLKFTLSDAASLIVDDLPGLQKIYSVLGRSDEFSENEQMKMVITTEKFFRSSYSNLVWVGFESTTTEFHSDTKKDLDLDLLYFCKVSKIF